MKNPINSNLFSRAIPRRSRPAAFVVAGVLAAAVGTTGGVLAFSPDLDGANPSAEPGVVELAFTPEKQAAPRTSEGRQQPAPANTGQATSPAAAEVPTPPASKDLSYDFEYQPNFYYCGPAATRIALSAQGHTPSQDAVAELLGTTQSGTNSSHDVAGALNEVLGKDVYQVREIPGWEASPAQMDRLQADAVASVGAGRAIVANIAGDATDVTGQWRSFPGGHYVTIVGYRDEGRQVQVADPSGVGPSRYWMSTIAMANWMASRGYSY